MSFSTSDFVGKKVYITSEESDDEIVVEGIGRLHYFIFKNFKCVGFFIKLPDVAMMFSRRDLFCHISSFSFFDRKIIVDSDFKNRSKKALKDFNIDLKTTVILDGQKVVTDSGEEVGFIENVVIDEDGSIKTFSVESGATSKALLGVRNLEGKFLKGYKSINEVKMMRANGAKNEGGGAIVVDDGALDIALTGGIAEKAAKKSVDITQRAKEYGQKASQASSPLREKAKDKMSQGGQVALEKLKESKQGIEGFASEFKKSFNGDK